MKRASTAAALSLSFLMTFAAFTSAHAQQAAATASVPRLIRFSGVAHSTGDTAQPGVLGITFSLYAESTGGSPLWMETQNVQPDATGHYSVLLGATKAEGMPADVFTSEQARWVGVRIEGQAEQARVLLLSVPYAIKAGDAETIGGLPPSAFMLASVPGSTTVINQGNSSATAPPAASSNVTTTGGTVNTIPLFSTASNIQNSILTQTATTAVNVGGKLNFPALAAATAAAGRASRPEAFVASSYNSATPGAVAQTFILQAEAGGNNTAAPFGTLDLLYGSGTTTPAETGFKINNKGLITFATGQTFPGTGKGTITGVVAGTGMTGGGTTGSVTLNLDATKVPELATNNVFAGTEQFKAAVGIGTTPMANGYTPLSVGTANTFGTWLALANTSAGGHTWNIISAGSGNAEGAGNLGITDLTGKSTIYLEGNTNTANLTATGNVSAAGTVGANALVVTSTAGAAIIDADGFGTNAGSPTPGLRFGGGGSGEAIASNRTVGLTKDGLDFYTNFTRRMSVLQGGQVAVGTASPGGQLGVVGSSNAFPGIYTQGGAAASGSGQGGSDGIDSYGNSGDTTSNSESVRGGAGITAYGGAGGYFGGHGVVAYGGNGNSVGGYGIAAFPGNGPNGAFAGYFSGDVLISGTLIGGAITHEMDHPLDPANKFLVHSAVESSEMKDIYDGNVTTDASGEAVVELPDWFESLNRDFRYQLTVIGQFSQAIVAEKIADHHFLIRTDKPNVEVSWQVTGVRQDAWANAHRLQVEQQKPDRERGHYLYPELYGAPEEMSIEWARHPQLMQRLQELRKKSLSPANTASVAETSSRN